VVVVSIENYACLTKRGLSILIKTTLFLFERIGPTGEKLLCQVIFVYCELMNGTLL